MSGVVAYLDEAHPKFPQTVTALRSPNGLLASGGNLDPQTLITAYGGGIFPWSGEDEPILWWCPDPRAVLFTEELHLPRSLRRQLRKEQYRVTMDTVFERVMHHCAQRPETWIRSDLYHSFCALHEQGYSHSIEVWNDEDQLVGGLYGIAIGRYFSGESMFSLCPNTSKIAVAYMVRQLHKWGFPMMDCQQPSAHLSMLGARTITRTDFLQRLSDYRMRQPVAHPWVLESFSSQSW